MKIVDKKEFQRLRGIKANANAHFVWPSNRHCRFTHCLGVYSLTKKYLTILLNNQPELKSQINERLLETIAIASLLHDAGHAQFCHLFDRYVASKLGIPDHEERVYSLIKYMKNKYDDIDLTGEEIELIYNLINGKEREGYPKWIFQIICSPHCQVETDKMDFIARDAYFCGIPCPIQVNRIINNTKVINDNICFQKKISFDLLELFVTRYKYFRLIYRHPVVIAADMIVIEILLKLAEKENWKNLFDSPDCKWIYLTDDIINSIPLRYNDDEHLISLYDKLMTRDFYKRDKNVEVPSSPQGKDNDTLIVDDVIGYTGKPNFNPFDHILFYDNNDHLTKLSPHQISSLYSNDVSEIHNHVFHKKSKHV